VAPLIAVEDLATFLQATIADDDPAALAAIDAASAAVRRETGQILTPVVADQVVLDGSGSGVLLLPELPVTAVTAISVDGTALETTAWRWTRSGLLYRLGAAYRYGEPWVAGAANVAVTYSHGFDPLPDDLKDVVARIAGRRYQAGQAVVSATGNEGIETAQLGQYPVTYQAPQSDTRDFWGASAAWLLLPSEKAALAPYRQRRLA
jgi:hypothetical protein